MALKVGVVGAGYFGTRHAQIYAGMKNVDLVAIADINAAAAQTLAAQTGATPYQNPSDLLEKVDALSITTPSPTHAEVALPYIREGLPILIEKPIAVHLHEAERILKASQKSGSPVLVGHVEQFNPAVEKLLSSSVKPLFIESVRLSQFSGRALDTDIVQDLLIHDIDIVLLLMRQKPKQIAAFGMPVLSQHIDIANARISFPDGGVAHVAASRVALENQRRMQVFSKKGFFSLNFQNKTLRHIDVPKSKSSRERPIFVAKSLESSGAVQPLEAELAHFVQVARGRVQPRVGPERAIEVLKLATRIVRSINTARPKEGR